MFGLNKKKDSRRKAELGFLILNLMAEIDGFFHHKENEVIVSFISDRLNPNEIPLDFQPALAQIEDTPSERYFDLLGETCKHFTLLSSTNERNELLLFALQLVNADNRIATSESAALKILNQQLATK